MNTIRKAQLFLLIPLLTIGHSGSTFAQGSLTPPGAPAPTFKTLSQVEPRFPISDYQTNLTISGSYYLTTNLFSGPNSNDGINIRTNVSNITIDLNGFSIINTNGAGPSSPVGVRISEGTNIVIRNGQIIGLTAPSGPKAYSTASSLRMFTSTIAVVQGLKPMASWEAAPRPSLREIVSSKGWMAPGKPPALRWTASRF